MLFDRIFQLLGLTDAPSPLSEVRFNRVLPVNETEIATVIEKLHGIVPEEELVKKWM